MKSNKKLDFKINCIRDKSNVMAIMPFIEDNERGLLAPISGFDTIDKDETN